MSGVIGHAMYAVLAGKLAVQRKLPIAELIHRHFASYLCGAYLGCDIQTMPEAICVDTGEEVGYGTAPVERSPLTGGKVRPWSLDFEGQSYRPREVHQLFYGRSHLVFGWPPSQRSHAVPWDHLADYCALVVEDAMALFGPGERKLAYLFGWAAHVVGDCLIKSIQPGVELELLDGQYTPRNRPIQDLVTYHEIGVKELGLNWPALLTALAESPVEPIQLHYMRIAAPRGKLANDFPNAWAPQYAPLLTQVLKENRRYQAIRTPRLLQKYELRKEGSRWECDQELSRQAGGLRYPEMVALADRANFRHALGRIGDATANLFEQIIERAPVLQELSVPPRALTWDELTSRWRRAAPSANRESFKAN